VYQVKIKKDAHKVLDKLPPKVQRNIREKIHELANDPRKLSGVEKLVGFDCRYRIPAGSFRVIFEIEDDELIVTVIKIGSRGDVYKAGGG
jgi:mRNA interferase RelE/StbE